ncbi:MAG: hypothetical protein ACE5J0_00140 [Candidatus Paceibacterales bacterium]
MRKKKLSKSLRKFIRREKARIRREVLDLKEQEKLIQELYQKYFKRNKKYEDQRNLQLGNKNGDRG